ncbi:IS66 family insertion sequence element accessory protein TnpB [Ensifer aridi]|uniref:IS66 family insertion sequence element accessory protein TnpB n=1 Tax=Ensifer aridi TaxID=1708715 RepID=UPI003B8A7F90
MPIYLACGVTDMRHGINGLSALVEAVIKEAPASGAIFGFRGKHADRIKLLFWDGQGFCLYYNDLRSYYTSFIFSCWFWPTGSVSVRRPDRRAGSIGCIVFAAGPNRGVRIGYVPGVGMATAPSSRIGGR